MNHLITDSQPSAALKWWRKTAAENKRLGLTAKGTQRMRAPNMGARKIETALRRQRALDVWNRRVIRMRMLGLTTRGKQRIYSVRRADALLLGSALENLASAISRSWFDLSPEGQVRALELESHLSAIRRQLV